MNIFTEQLRGGIDNAILLEVLDHSIDQFKAHFLVSHFAPLEHQRHTQFVAIGKEFFCVFDLHTVVIGINVKSELDLFRLLSGGVLLLVFQFFLLFIDQFSEVLNTAHRRCGIFRNQHKIKPRFTCLLTRRSKFHDPQLFARCADHQKIDIGESPIVTFQQLGDGIALLY